MSPRRASLPPPLPLHRARPDSPLRFRSGRDRPDCSLPPPTPGGGIITISKPSKPSTPAPPSSLPPPLPLLRARPDSPLRFRSGRDRPDCSLPPPTPGGGFLSHQFIPFNTIIVCPPHPPQDDFFSFARSFTWSHASLRFGLGPGERPRKGFTAPHTIKAIVNNT